MMFHAVIMAGGSGRRFWPMSRRRRPKQLLALLGGRPILRATFERLAPLLPPDQLWVVTAASTADDTRRLLPELAADHVLAEPVGRDTAACVGFAAAVLERVDPGAVCAVLPADHVIGAEHRFRAALAAGARHVSERGGLLTFGVRPSRAETGYGYLELGAHAAEVDGWQVHRLERFVEKPDPDTALRYLAGGRHLWNSGVFVWRAAELLAEIGRQLPELAAGLAELAAALGTSSAGEVLDRVYPRLPKTSVDYGIMEGAASCWTIPVDFGWSDVGSWPALAELLARDPHGNATSGRTLVLAGQRNVLVSDGPAIAVAGLDGVVVVATGDAVLVIPAAEAQRVKEIVAELEARGWDDVL